jgi:hypothetical protein
MNIVKLFFLVPIIFSTIMCEGQHHIQKYTTVWKDFYPSEAVSLGMYESIFDYEDFSMDRINEWLALNKASLKIISGNKPNQMQGDKINNRLLKIRILNELDTWERKEMHKTSLKLYADLILNAIDPVQDASYLLESERLPLISKRFQSIIQLCEAATQNLVSVTGSDKSRYMDRLVRARDLYQAHNWSGAITEKEDWDQKCNEVRSAISKLINYVDGLSTDQIKTSSEILGLEAYSRELNLYTDGLLTPEELSKIAMEEINLVKNLMAEVSRSYLKAQYPGRAMPNTELQVIQAALADMEKDVPLNGEDYLQFWNELAVAAEKFVDEKSIATLPVTNTLRIKPAPESAGPAARIGWVSSAPPFAPNPVTTLYLPSIPETIPQQEKKDFWSSFNKPFNRMIVIHELIPGHYMQIKISRETPHKIRLLFPYALYFEGWASFCEEIVLAEGWEKENQLTYLAHLRKRLENANRAYTSVQTHCYGWDQEKVMEFSTNTSLVAPQFAKSLWGRLMRSPMQLTSYFLGGQQFRSLYLHEVERQGDNFILKDFMDTIMKAGPIPIDEFYQLFDPASVK